MKLAKTNQGTIIDLEFAHKVVQNNIKTIKVKGKPKEVIFGGLTTSKLRGLMEEINRLHMIVFNKVDDELSEDIIDEIEYVKVKFYYEAGREKTVNEFLKKTFMFDILNRVIKKKSKKYFLDYCKYFEALVAFAKYYQKED